MTKQKGWVCRLYRSDVWHLAFTSLQKVAEVAVKGMRWLDWCAERKPKTVLDISDLNLREMINPDTRSLSRPGRNCKGLDKVWPRFQIYTAGHCQILFSPAVSNSITNMHRIIGDAACYRLAIELEFLQLIVWLDLGQTRFEDIDSVNDIRGCDVLTPDSLRASNGTFNARNLYCKKPRKTWSPSAIEKLSNLISPASWRRDPLNRRMMRGV